MVRMVLATNNRISVLQELKQYFQFLYEVWRHRVGEIFLAFPTLVEWLQGLQASHPFRTTSNAGSRSRQQRGFSHHSSCITESYLVQKPPATSPYFSLARVNFTATPGHHLPDRGKGVARG